MGGGVSPRLLNRPRFALRERFYERVRHAEPDAFVWQLRIDVEPLGHAVMPKHLVVFADVDAVVGARHGLGAQEHLELA